MKMMQATLIWPEQHVMFFVDELSEEYEDAKASGWFCFCTSDHFDENELLRRIGVKNNGNHVS